MPRRSSKKDANQIAKSLIDAVIQKSESKNKTKKTDKKTATNPPSIDHRIEENERDEDE